MRVFLALGLLFLGVASAQAKCEGSEQVIKLGGYIDVQHTARNRAFIVLQDAVNKELQGKACLEFVNDATTLKGGLGVTALQSNTVQLLAPSFSTMARFASEYRVFSLPFAFRDLEALERFQRAATQQFSMGVEARDLQPLSFWHLGFEQLATKRPLQRPSDAAGMKFQKNDDADFLRMLSLVNATVTTIAEDDLAVAAKEGRVGAVSALWTQINSQSYVKTLGNVSETNHRFSGYQVLAKKSWWTGLDAALRTSLTEIISRISRQVNFETTARLMGARRSLMRSDTKVWTLTRQQREKWLTVQKPLYSDYFSSQKPELKIMLETSNAGL